MAKVSKLELTTTVRNLEAEKLAYEWAVMGGDKSPRAWMLSKGLTEDQYKAVVEALPAPQWYVRRKEVQDKLTESLVRSQVDFVTEMNDTHIKAAKLGLAKAIDLMTRLKIEEKRDKKGNVYFAGFRPADLLRCLESIRVAQAIQRRAMGLPNDEGAISVWQKIQHERTSDEALRAAAAGSTTTVTETVTVETQIKTLSDALSYDDIRLLIEAERRKKAETVERVIEAEVTKHPS